MGKKITDLTPFTGVDKADQLEHSTIQPNASCVKDTKTGDIILKIINTGVETVKAEADLSRFGSINSKARLIILSGNPNAKNTIQSPNIVLPVESEITVEKLLSYQVPPYSLNIIRISKKG